MQKCLSRARGFSIPAPAARSELVVVGKKGPQLTRPCPDCDGFDTVVGRGAAQITFRCTCELGVTG